MRNETFVRAARVAGIYAVVAVPWIIFSDRVAAWMFPDIQAYAAAASIKGCFFVAVTGVLLFGLFRREIEAHDRKRKENEALQQSDALLALFLKHSPIYAFIKEVAADESRVLVVSENYQNMIGIPASEMTGKTMKELFPAEFAAKITADDLAVVSSGKVLKQDEDLNGRNYTTIKFPLSMGGRNLLAGYTIDITDRKQVEAALRESEAMLNETGRMARIGGWVIDLEKGTLKWTREVYAIHEVEESFQPTVEAAINFYVPDSRPVIRQAVEQSIRTGEPFDVELEVITARNRRIWVQSIGHTLLESGKAKIVSGTFQDITERRQAEEKLRESEERYRLLADNTEDFVALSEAAGHDIYLSPSYERHFGLTIDALQADGKIMDIHPDDRESVARARAENLAGRGTTIEYRLRDKTGGWTWLEGRCTPIVDTRGRVEKLLLVSHDITRRKQAEEESSRLATIVEQAPECIVITGTDGAIQYVNPAFERVTGYTRAEVAGQNPHFLKSGKHDATFYKEMWAVLSRGEVWTGHLVNKRKDGALFEEDATISPVRNPAGQIVGYAAIKHDVTEHVLLRAETDKLQAQFLQAQKMETIGRLAGGVAHDFNNLLQAILGYCEIVLNSTPPDDTRHADLLEIQKTGRRASDLTRQLLALGRKQNLNQRVTDINILIEDFNKMLQRVIGEDIRIEFDLARGLDRVLVDHGQIGQILLNLAVNARDAMPHGGRLFFKTERKNFSAEDLVAQPDVQAGTYICVSVTDSGTGIPPAIREKIFEPFFTTKVSGKGTGLGLATSYGIARQHGGWIDVYSEVGQGSSFKLYLPAVEHIEEPLDAQRKSHPPEAPRGAGQRILFVEDEDTIRAMVKRQLEHNGYTVTAVADATAAVGEFVHCEGRYDLVLTDVVLPDISGLELLADLTARKPGLLVLISSGYTDNEKRWPFILERKWPFIGKPYTTAELLATLHKIFARS